jgi:hypothetical protein
MSGRSPDWRSLRSEAEAQLMSGEIAKARNHTDVFYVGLGDQFDDDRRLVREATSEFRPAIRPTLVGASRPVIFAAGRLPLGSNTVMSLQTALAVFARFVRLRQLCPGFWRAFCRWLQGSFGC